MNRLVSAESPCQMHVSSLPVWSARGAAAAMVIACLMLGGRGTAGEITISNFDSGDLTGWYVNTLIPPATIPASADVIDFKGNLVGALSFSTSVGGRYAGSLSRDFYTGNETELHFNYGITTSGMVEPDIVSSLDIIVENLDTRETIVQTLHYQNILGESGLGLQFNALAGAFAHLPGTDTHVRLQLLMDLHTLDGFPTSAQLLVDNLVLVPESSSWVFLSCAALPLGCMRWLRSKS